MDFVVTALDAPDGRERRLQHRAAHLEGARRMAADGRLVSAGALLDADGDMIGSTLHVSFDSREELQAWLDLDPYVTGDVWREIEVREIRLARLTEAPTAG